MSILRILATPIGNLEDISLRALRVLKESDFILCEDTRLTKRLLDRYQIVTPTISYHQHSSDFKIDRILKLIEDDKKLALVSDAGTPGLSDPGAKLVSILREKFAGKIKIESVPGASALTAAISIAGLGFDHFLFLGFLPNKKGRQKKLREIFSSKYSVIIYESKHRILKLIKELEKMSQELGIDLELGIARELTKIHESFYQGSPQELSSILKKDIHNLKGEFVVLIKKKK